MYRDYVYTTHIHMNMIVSHACDMYTYNSMVTKAYSRVI